MELLIRFGQLQADCFAPHCQDALVLSFDETGSNRKTKTECLGSFCLFSASTGLALWELDHSPQPYSIPYEIQEVKSFFKVDDNWLVWVHEGREFTLLGNYGVLQRIYAFCQCPGVSEIFFCQETAIHRLTLNIWQDLSYPLAELNEQIHKLRGIDHGHDHEPEYLPPACMKLFQWDQSSTKQQLIALMVISVSLKGLSFWDHKSFGLACTHQFDTNMLEVIVSPKFGYFYVSLEDCLVTCVLSQTSGIWKVEILREERISEGMTRVECGSEILVPLHKRNS